MPRGPVYLGVAIGAAAAIGILAAWPLGRPAAALDPPTGAVLSECDGPLSELVIQYIPEAAATVAPIYKQFLAYLPPDVTVHVVCPDRAAYDDLRSRVGATACTLSPVLTGHPITAWARDRWVALAPADARSPTTLLHPRGEDNASAWPQRAGDQRVADDIARALAPRVAARKSPLYFDGGDFAADSATVFATVDVALRNIQHTVKSRCELTDSLARTLHRAVVLFEKAPSHHAGMYLMPIGHRTILVADPSLGLRALGGQPLPAGVLPCGADFSPQTQSLFDAVADRCTAEGYKVLRLPVIPGLDGRTYLTYVNVLLDDRPGRRTVYMPTYRGVEPLNASAAAIWRSAGFDVRPVDCTGAYIHFGSLQCLVNVLRR
ncbi:MAG: hypothetical protein NTV86_09790 [Planctomycetota bacterium]|nr:hypothetical protein [Planctomycetota bacterium]